MPGGGGGGWHKVLVVGSVSMWRRLLASRLEPSAMTSKHPYYCGHPYCRGHPPSWVGIQNATSALSSPDGLISARHAVITKTPGWEVLTITSNVNVTQGHGC